MASNYSLVLSCHLGFNSGLCLLHTKIRLGQCLCIKLFAPFHSVTWYFQFIAQDSSLLAVLFQEQESIKVCIAQLKALSQATA